MSLRLKVSPGLLCAVPVKDIPLPRQLWLCSHLLAAGLGAPAPQDAGVCPPMSIPTLFPQPYPCSCSPQPVFQMFRMTYVFISRTPPSLCPKETFVVTLTNEIYIKQPLWLWLVCGLLSLSARGALSISDCTPPPQPPPRPLTEDRKDQVMDTAPAILGWPPRPCSGSFFPLSCF